MGRGPRQAARPRCRRGGGRGRAHRDRRERKERRADGVIADPRSRERVDPVSRPDEDPQRLGEENFSAVVELISSHAIDWRTRARGALTTAVEPHQVDWMAEASETAARFGHDAVLLDAEATRAEVNSPLYLAGLIHRPAPARSTRPASRGASAGSPRTSGPKSMNVPKWCAWPGAAPVSGSRRSRGPSTRDTHCWRAAPAVASSRRSGGESSPSTTTSGHGGPSPAVQLASIGSANRQGLSDASNQFHYYRLTADNRVLFGGFDAVYHYGNGKRRSWSRASTARPAWRRTSSASSRSSKVIDFSHRWGGAIDTCSRFFAFYGTAHRGAVPHT